MRCPTLEVRGGEALSTLRQEEHPLQLFDHLCTTTRDGTVARSQLRSGPGLSTALRQLATADADFASDASCDAAAAAVDHAADSICATSSPHIDVECAFQPAASTTNGSSAHGDSADDDPTYGNPANGRPANGNSSDAYSTDERSGPSTVLATPAIYDGSYDAATTAKRKQYV